MSTPLPEWWGRSRAPLVYVTSGPCSGTCPWRHGCTGARYRALAGLPIRALLTVGSQFDRSTLGSIPSNVRVEAWVEQAAVLPHAELVVCHGGSGTIFGALAAGVPVVVVPLFADQFDNGRCVAEAGAGWWSSRHPTEVAIRPGFADEDAPSLAEAIIPHSGDLLPNSSPTDRHGDRGGADGRRSPRRTCDRFHPRVPMTRTRLGQARGTPHERHGERRRCRCPRCWWEGRVRQGVPSPASWYGYGLSPIAPATPSDPLMSWWSRHPTGSRHRALKSIVDVEPANGSTCPTHQQRLKLQFIVEALERSGVTCPDPNPSVELAPWAFRTTIKAAVTDGRAGYLRPRSHQVIPVDSCLVAHPLLVDLLVDARYPGARQVLLRCGARTGERLAATTPSGLTSVAERCADRSSSRARGGSPMADLGTIVLPDRAPTEPRRWRSSSVRPPTNWARRPPVDLYSGVGLFAGVLAARGWSVTAVEGSPSAVADATFNLQRLRRFCRPRRRHQMEAHTS